MLFHYVASNAEGKIVEDSMEAGNTDELLAKLGAQGLRPISIKIAKGFGGGVRARLFGPTFTTLDQLFLTKYLALMLRAGTDLFKAIDILINDFEKPTIKALLLQIRSNLEKGNPFYTTFAQYPKFFSSAFVNLIRAGEKSGTLDKVLEDLSVSLEREQELRGRIRSALIYPVVLLAASFIILLLLVTFALPKIAEVFMTGGFEPPLFSRVVFGVGLFISNNIIYVLILLASAAFGGWYVLSKNINARRVLQRFAFRVPYLGEVLRKTSLQRFTSTFSSLMRAGLHITDSLEITSRAVGWEELKEALMRVSREGLVKGMTVGDAFRREQVFPKVVVNLVAISEKAGHLEDILDTLSKFYESEIDNSIKTLVSFLEPAMLLVLGVIIGTIALSIIVPIYQLIGSI
ncbi:hypothetical protein A3A20_01335 [Candidatus Wolfebacteria bacterium RIFCSPLOWO2_01_FULL_45_19]|uniref:Type II secretion system protein GspF domain-containing protein n=1 Tax=Candidatus Wolfebacteria bacterium RIFCSPLOWO2_01_FULL_45_19 TaxID=1802557 RepID=A0A1F8DSH0_9BACT|nr:MAG: Type II secretion system protein [Parcubacteria group bacterium GW2011_GWB1_45_9]OGM91570.1 MAG: hypothetical protein A3A20_01335 [Candidatus Wolfebacteria bacterium RIFCSPLOWO2_01_FULL_45_19]